MGRDRLVSASNETVISVRAEKETMDVGGDDIAYLDVEITDENGKTVKNYGVKKVRELNYDSKYWDAVQSGMRRVVTGANSSVSSIFSGVNYQIAGKTGTAQEDRTRPNHALFISYGPYNDPEISVTAVIPFGYTSSNAASLAKDIYDYYFANDNEKAQLEKNNTATEAASGVSGD